MNSIQRNGWRHFPSAQKLIKHDQKLCLDGEETLDPLIEEASFNKFQINLNDIICKTIHCDASFFMFLDCKNRRLIVNVLHDKILPEALYFPYVDTFFETILITGKNSRELSEKFKQQFFCLFQMEVESILCCYIKATDNILLQGSNVIGCLVNKRFVETHHEKVCLPKTSKNMVWNAKCEFLEADERKLVEIINSVSCQFTLNALQKEENEKNHFNSRLVEMNNIVFNECNNYCKLFTDGLHMKIRDFFKAERVIFFKSLPKKKFYVGMIYHNSGSNEFQMQVMISRDNGFLSKINDLQNIYSDHDKELDIQLPGDDYTVRNYMCSPIKNGGQFIGIYLLCNKFNAKCFTDEDKHIFKYFVPRFAIINKDLEN